MRHEADAAAIEKTLVGDLKEKLQAEDIAVEGHGAREVADLSAIWPMIMARDDIGVTAWLLKRLS